MSTVSFEWDENRNTVNKKKRGIVFEEARTVFYDEDALVIHDIDHSQDEERFIIPGMSLRANLLVVCHCLRESETVIRIISARRATPNETKQYESWR